MQVLTAKRANQGMSGAIQVLAVPSAAMAFSPRHTVAPDIVTSIRPMGATLTFAHVSHTAGGVQISLQVRANQLRYHRFGVAHTFQGNASIDVATYGFARYRTWMRLAGSSVVETLPRAALKYTSAPIRNYVVLGSTRSVVQPLGVLEHTLVGMPYGVQGGSEIRVTPSGAVSVTRETSYSIEGRITVSLIPSALMVAGTGDPVHYQVSGQTVLDVVPSGSMGVVEGLIDQHAIVGAMDIRLTPAGRTAYRTPPLFGRPRPGGRRRLIRIFR